MMWYEKVGFSSNPFSIKPAAFHDEIIGQNLKTVMEKVEDGGFVFVKGDYGTGKTTVLKRIINRYRGKGKLIYINLDFLDNVRVKDLLNKRAGTLQRLFGMLPDDVILLVDEAQLMKKQFGDDMQEHFENGYIRSIVFVGTDFSKNQFSHEMLRSLNENIISLKSISLQDAVKIIRMRIGEVLLSDKIIKEIFAYSKNPRQFLENCEDVCKYVVDIYSTEADSEHVKTVLGRRRVERIKKAVSKIKKVKREPEEKKEQEIEEINEESERKVAEIKESQKEPEKKTRKKRRAKEAEKENFEERKDEEKEAKEKKREHKKGITKGKEEEEYLKEGKGKPSEEKTRPYYIDNADEYPEYSFKQEEEEKGL